MTSIFEKEVIYTTDADSFNLLVRKAVTPLVHDDAKKAFKTFMLEEKFECWHKTSITTTVYTGDCYSEYIKLCGKKVMNNEAFDFHELMTFMVKHDIIFPGKYIINMIG